MYALIALAVAFVVYTAFLLQCFKPAPPPPVQHPKQSWWDPASIHIHIHECRLDSFLLLLLLLWNWKLLKNRYDIIYTTTKACLRVERDRKEWRGGREQMKKFNKNNTTHTHHRHTDTSHLKECNELSSCKSSKLDDKYDIWNDFMTTSTRNAAPSIVREERIKERESLVTKHCKYYINNYYNTRKSVAFTNIWRNHLRQFLTNQSINQPIYQSVNQCGYHLTWRQAINKPINTQVIVITFKLIFKYNYD